MQTDFPSIEHIGEQRTCFEFSPDYLQTMAYQVNDETRATNDARVTAIVGA